MSEKENKVGDGKLVAYAYKLIDTANGNVLFEATADAPDVMIYGDNPEVVPGLLVALKGLGKGDKFDVTLPPAAGFGDVSSDLVMHLPHNVFLNEEGKWPEEVKEGAELPMMTNTGQLVRGRVLKITPEEVVMDFNHPFAGKTVRFDGEVVEVRDATPEEIEASKGHGCGCGCNHDGCGCGDGCDCGNHEGDNCGCTDGGDCSCGDNCDCK